MTKGFLNHEILIGRAEEKAKDTNVVPLRMIVSFSLKIHELAHPLFSLIHLLKHPMHVQMSAPSLLLEVGYVHTCLDSLFP